LGSSDAALVRSTLLCPLFPINKIETVEQQVWVAHCLPAWVRASRVLVPALRRNNLFLKLDS
jgi:hypothetical protein